MANPDTTGNKCGWNDPSLKMVRSNSPNLMDRLSSSRDRKLVRVSSFPTWTCFHAHSIIHNNEWSQQTINHSEQDESVSCEHVLGWDRSSRQRGGQIRKDFQTKEPITLLSLWSSALIRRWGDKNNAFCFTWQPVCNIYQMSGECEQGEEGSESGEGGGGGLQSCWFTV